MRKLQSILKWLAKHIVIRGKNLNDDKEAKPKPTAEVGIKVEF